jgi:hypothetical protein
MANDVENLVDDVFGTLRGKKADEIVDSLKLSSGLRRKKGGNRRIGAGGGAGGPRKNARSEFENIEEHEEEGDDALAAMMNQLGVDHHPSSK